MKRTTLRTRRTTCTSQRAKLNAYAAKRDVAATGEPAAISLYGSSWRDGGEFVIHEHAARQHHFDLRLEMGGVLKSWAIPKGIPLEDGTKVLAIEVEDHPAGYATFEGVIPAGHYGAGTVLLWDRGTYRVESGTAEEGLEAGKLALVLRGVKCTGRWLLLRMRRSDGVRPAWLLIKRRDLEVRRPPAKRRWTRSVASGRTLDEIRTRGTASRGLAH